MIVMREIWT